MEVVEILVQGLPRKVTLVAETEVLKGRLIGALKRELIDDDGGLHVRYDAESLTDTALLALRREQATPEAVALARSLSAEARARVLRAPSGTTTRIQGVCWARHGSLYLVGRECLPVPRSLVSASPTAQEQVDGRRTDGVSQ